MYCGAYYFKDEKCDSVTCLRDGCRRHFCFSCGVEISKSYTDNHMVLGPSQDGGRLVWGCARTFLRRAIDVETPSTYKDAIRNCILPPYKNSEGHKLSPLLALEAIQVYEETDTERSQVYEDTERSVSSYTERSQVDEGTAWLSGLLLSRLKMGRINPLYEGQLV